MYVRMYCMHMPTSYMSSTVYSRTTLSTLLNCGHLSRSNMDTCAPLQPTIHYTYVHTCSAILHMYVRMYILNPWNEDTSITRNSLFRSEVDWNGGLLYTCTYIRTQFGTPKHTGSDFEHHYTCTHKPIFSHSILMPSLHLWWNLSITDTLGTEKQFAIQRLPLLRGYFTCMSIYLDPQAVCYTEVSTIRELCYKRSHCIL
jgi:hypothetical protein